MKPEALELFGKVLRDYFNGDIRAEIRIRRDDGYEAMLPAGYFFREPSELSSIETEALDECRGRVLDVGAGSGCHSLLLQERGLQVTAIDLNPDCVRVMVERGVAEVRPADFFEFREGPFETVLLLGHGVGLAETLSGLDRLLEHAKLLVTEDGQLLLDSLDVRMTEDPRHLEYHEENRKAGRYIGETRLQFEYGGRISPYCRWLHVDPETLEEHARKSGWRCEVLLKEDSGDYLARLNREVDRS